MKRVRQLDINPKPTGKPKLSKFELFTVDPNNWKFSIMLCQIELRRKSFFTRHAILGWRCSWTKEHEYRVCLFFMEFAYNTKRKEYAENDKH